MISPRVRHHRTSMMILLMCINDIIRYMSYMSYTACFTVPNV